MPPLSGLLLDRCYTGLPPRKHRPLLPREIEPRNSQARSGSSQLLMQASQQVSLLTPRATAGFVPGAAVGVRAFAGVAQLVEHLFCKQVVSGSIPLASSGEDLAASPQAVLKTSEGCPSGQREQAVNLPAHAYVGSNPTPSTSLGSSAPPRWSESSGAPPQVLGPRPQNSRRVSLACRETLRTEMTLIIVAARGMRNSPRGLRPSRSSAGVTQLVESQFSKLKVDGSSPFSRSTFRGASRTKLDPVCVTSTNTAHLAQLVEHVLGKDEVTSSSLVVGSAEVQP